MSYPVSFSGSVGVCWAGSRAGSVSKLMYCQICLDSAVLRMTSIQSGHLSVEVRRTWIVVKINMMLVVLSRMR